ncbi:5-oxoprolinase subunit PxpA [Brevibacterium casei]|uniref:5-oxoprolinase subunit PxpA n=1 Tax=Brevibacterium casei TaxID=33889 RepID=UPI00191961DD|nr:5-oxoprolinase subunit PxpA [Brevibacterium casei]QQT69793.1 5-oxoprolinase subunit PxpA [Brevibacterium casei]
MTKTINADLGEGIGLHAFGNDPELMTLIDVANVACGFHAADPHIMNTTVELAAENDVKVGAHPGLPDLAGFGRRAMVLSPAEVEDIVTYQVGALAAFLDRHDLPLNHIKPHGALYGMVGRDPELMAAVARVALVHGVPIFGLANTAHKSVCDELGVPFVAELYVDLGYDSDGKLVIERSPKPAVPADAAARVTSAMTTGTIRATDGTDLTVDFDSVCVHSDPSNAAEVVRAVRAAIDDAER